MGFFTWGQQMSEKNVVNPPNSFGLLDGPTGVTLLHSLSQLLTAGAASEQLNKSGCALSSGVHSKKRGDQSPSGGPQ